MYARLNVYLLYIHVQIKTHSDFRTYIYRGLRLGLGLDVYVYTYIYRYTYSGQSGVEETAVNQQGLTR
jgi:hypothetical protein